MMNQQQKIYIDVDEEITTVIDHIHHTKGSDISLIVPQHALLLQSVVNLKLLAQEAKKYKKNIILMTRDEDGIAFAQRAGIAIQPFIAQEDNDEIEATVLPRQTEKKPVPKYAEKIMEEIPQQRVDAHMGSQSFFGDGKTHNTNVAGMHAIRRSDTDAVKQNNFTNTHKQRPQVNAQRQVVDNYNIHNDAGTVTTKNQMTTGNVVVQKRQVTQQRQERDKDDEHLDEYEQSLRDAQLSNGVINNIQPQQRRNLQHEVVQTKGTKNKITRKTKKSKKHNSMAMSSVTGTAVKGFVFGGIILIVCILFIVVLPKTSISVDPKHINIDEKMELTAQTDQSVYDAERRLVPARLIERDITFTKTFDATGSGDVKAQKAQGKITIINEYSNKPQPLVATTRFLAEDGTLFRLVNQTTVPGMSDGEPGKVEALVMADIEGDGGNIGPTKFSIPGFKSSPKEGKFYATSEKAMTGGGTGGKGVTIVTEDDITKAETEMMNELTQYNMEQITGLLRPNNEVLLEENVISEVVSSEANVSAGTMTEQFMYEVVSHVKALVFSEDDVLAVMESNLAEKYQQYNASQVEVQVEYEDVVPDFEEESVKMKAHGTADVVTTVDVTAFKEDIIGKKHEELLKIMEDDYGTEIEKITIESVLPSFPGFIANHISRFGFMTDVFVK